MRRPKWLSGWGKGKNVFEASLIIDVPGVKVVEATFNDEPVLFAIGTARQRAVPGGKATAAGEGRGNDLEWRVFYDSASLPGFMPIDRAKEFMAGAVALSSLTASVYGEGTVFVASGKRSKGNAPALLDYEIAKKVEEARRKRGGI
ncbi:MAG: hypothetical protein JTT11_03700 [Candidatus Brockarchaeota archaeon]|nr:hypothetical protein [Candidatus Brockarchaeota archaeon]